MSGFLDSVDLKTIFLSNDIIKMTPVSYFISLEAKKFTNGFRGGRLIKVNIHTKMPSWTTHRDGRLMEGQF